MAGTGIDHLRNPHDTLLRVENLVVEFKTARGTVHAVSDVSFDVGPTETVSIVGESGSGKSTIARAVMQLLEPVAGQVWFEGRDLSALSAKALQRLRPELQMIFQDPIASLNPRRRVRDVVSEGLAVWSDRAAGPIATQVEQLMSEVGLTPAMGARRPSELSGGQCQRVAIARSLALGPKMIVCDEPVSALDVSVQAQILNLLRRMKAAHGLSLLFISHDLGVVKNISDRVMVLYLGKVCETAPTDQLFARPAHPYTQLLLESVPRAQEANHPHRHRISTSVEPPSPLDPPSGCRFRTRCPLATDRCRTVEPILRQVGPDHFAACHYAEQALAKTPWKSETDLTTSPAGSR